MYIDKKRNLKNIRECDNSKIDISSKQNTYKHVMSLVPSKMGMFPNKLYESIKLLNLRPGIYIIMQKAVILNTCRIIRMFLTEQRIRSAWSVRTVLF